MKLAAWEVGMGTLTDKARHVSYADGVVRIVMESGAEYQFPVADNPRLANGSPSELSNIEISPFGIHWPDLDEDLSFSGISRGDHGQSNP